MWCYNKKMPKINDLAITTRCHILTTKNMWTTGTIPPPTPKVAFKMQPCCRLFKCGTKESVRKRGP